jgi:hypothetical protein
MTVYESNLFPSNLLRLVAVLAAKNSDPDECKRSEVPHFVFSLTIAYSFYSCQCCAFSILDKNNEMIDFFCFSLNSIIILIIKKFFKISLNLHKNDIHENMRR